ncbi:MAG: hypothetical protein HRT47_05105 [Candidatus Caenarcaniphilales bacterium]|nr:hypothetical protein [Candidatus Caenarcaniphilales bacterium]
MGINPSERKISLQNLYKIVDARNDLTSEEKEGVKEFYNDSDNLGKGNGDGFVTDEETIFRIQRSGDEYASFGRRIIMHEWEKLEGKNPEPLQLKKQELLHTEEYVNGEGISDATVPLSELKGESHHSSSWRQINQIFDEIAGGNETVSKQDLVEYFKENDIVYADDMVIAFNNTVENEQSFELRKKVLQDIIDNGVISVNNESGARSGQTYHGDIKLDGYQLNFTAESLEPIRLTGEVNGQKIDYSVGGVLGGRSRTPELDQKVEEKIRGITNN